MNGPDRVAAFGLVMASVAVVVLSAAFYWRQTASPVAFSQAAEAGTHWEQLRNGRNVLGREDAAHTLVVFIDYQCSVCRDYNLMLQDLLRVYPEEVKIVVWQNPLRAIHPMADLAANAAVCAGNPGKFSSMHAALFAHQDSFSVNILASLARNAELPDSLRFLKCVEERRAERSVGEGVRLAYAMRLRRSPSVLLDGKLLGSTPNLDELAAAGGFSSELAPDGDSARASSELPH